jgi:hypothetical protein
MICYVCNQEGHLPTPAVAIGRSGSVAFCLAHLAAARGTRPGGTDMGCPHILPGIGWMSAVSAS